MLPTSLLTRPRRLFTSTVVEHPVLAGSTQTAISHHHGVPGIDIAARSANRSGAFTSPQGTLQAPAFSVDVEADVDEGKIEEFGSIRLLAGGNAEMHTPRIGPCTETYIDILSRDIRNLADTVNTYSHSGPVVRFSDLIEDHAGFRDVYARYMEGQFNGRIDRTDLFHLCDMLRQLGYLAPSSYISPEQRQLTAALLTGNTRPEIGVGKLRGLAICQFDEVVRKVGGINAETDLSEPRQVLMEGMHSRIRSSELLLHVRQGETANLILLLSMRDLHAIPGLGADLWEKAFVKAMGKGYDDTAMHLLLYLDYIDEKVLPERLDAVLRWFLDANTLVHPDLIWELVARGANPNTRGSATGDTALHFACKNNHPRLVSFLLSLHANPLLENAQGKLAIDQMSRPGASRVYVPTKFTWKV
jgi:hypothetical protein